MPCWASDPTRSWQCSPSFPQIWMMVRGIYAAFIVEWWVSLSIPRTLSRFSTGRKITHNEESDPWHQCDYEGSIRAGKLRLYLPILRELSLLWPVCEYAKLRVVHTSFTSTAAYLWTYDGCIFIIPIDNCLFFSDVIRMLHVQAQFKQEHAMNDVRNIVK